MVEGNMGTSIREIRTAVITGATGMIGTALVKYLLSRGIQVAALVRPGTRKAERLTCPYVFGGQEKNALKQGKLHIIGADLEELKEDRVFEELSFKTGGADAFFHLGWSGTFGASRNDMYLQNRNVTYTLDAVQLAERLGCSVFVGAGSQAEYGRVRDGESLRADTPAFPENGYGIAKLCAGQMSRIACGERGICHLWMRILSVYGPWDTEQTMVMSAVNTLLAGGRPVFSKGEQLWDYLYVRDAARALFLAAEAGKDGRVYPLGSGQVRPLREYICLIRDAVKPGAEIGIGELPYQSRQVMYLRADIGKLTEDTGFVPEYTFEEGIRETAAWQLERNKRYKGYEENQCSDTML